MKARERVLNEDGTWSSFPEQLRRFQEFHGWVAPLQEEGTKDPVIPHGEKGKSELNNKQKKKEQTVLD